MNQRRDARKAAKQAARKDRVRKQALNAAVKSLYPRFVIHRADKSNELEPHVRTAIRETDFSDRDRFSDATRQMLKELAAGGLESVRLELPEGTPEAARQSYTSKIVGRRLMLDVFSKVFELVPESVRRNAIPFRDCEFQLSGDQFLVNFDQLSAIRDRNRVTGYHSKFQPTLDVDGQRRIVAFSRHAIEQACKRKKRDWIEYGASGDLFALFSKCVYFELTELTDGSQAAVMYDGCNCPGTYEFEIARNVIGLQRVPMKGTIPIYYKLGYFPIVEHGDYWLATTFLPPGFSKTEERMLLERSDLNCVTRAKYIDTLSDPHPIETAVKDTLAMDALRWLHANGLAQVKSIHEPVFCQNRLMNMSIEDE